MILLKSGHVISIITFSFINKLLLEVADIKILNCSLFKIQIWCCLRLLIMISDLTECWGCFYLVK